MYSCSQCGKKVIFSFQLKNGLCRSCLANKATPPPQPKAEEQPDKLAEAKAFLSELITLHQAMEINLRTASFEEAEHAAFACKVFIEKMALLPEIPEAGTVIKDIAEKNILWWEIPGLGRVDYDEEKDLIMLGELFQKSQKLENELAPMIEHSVAFEELLHSLHFVTVDIQPSKSQSPTKNQTWPSLRTYNVTARTPIARLERFIALDVETTGLNPIENEIIQIAAIRFMNFHPIEVFATYIKPRKGLNAKAAKINHITEAQILESPYFEDIQDAFTSFIAGSDPLVGHNLSFDCNFLVASGISFSTLFEHKAYDTLDLAKRVFPQKYSYALDAVCRSELHVIRDNAHDAVSDTLATGLLFKKICQERIGF